MKETESDRESGVGARVVVNEKAPGGYVAPLGTILETALGVRYGVRFDNQKELIVHLDSECFDPVAQARSSPNARRIDKGRMRVR